MRSLESVLNESFYKNVSHGDTIFKAELFLHEIIDMSKKMNVVDVDHMFYRELDKKIPAGFSIACVDKDDNVKYILVHRPGSGAAQWQSYIKNKGRPPKDLGWAFPSRIVRDIIEYYENYNIEKFKVVKTEDII